MEDDLLHSYTIRALHHLGELRSAAKWTDITLRSAEGAVDFPAHRCILSSASPFFRAMLESGKFVESEKEVVIIKETSDEAIAILLDFIYSGTAELTNENIETALQIASLTQVDELLISCEQFLMSGIDLDNVADMWTLASRYDLNQMQNHILNFVGRKLMKIDMKVVLRFEADMLHRLLSKSIITTSETNVLATVLHWLQFNYKCREKHAKPLLNLIFWDRIHSKDIRAVGLKSFKPLRNIITEFAKKPSPSIPRGMQPGIILAGGFSAAGTLNTVRFLPLENTEEEGSSNWKSVTKLPTESRLLGFGLCGLPDGGFIVTGGVTVTPNATEVPLRISLLFDHQTCRNFAYAFGGDASGPATFERYNICNNTWDLMGQLPHSIQDSSLQGLVGCVVRDRIWISGGLTSSDRPIDEVWSFNPENVNGWRKEPKLPVPCSEHSLFFYKDRLYRIGGYGGNPGVQHWLTEVHSYSPETGWIVEDWKLERAEAFQQFVVHGDRLYVVGGGPIRASERLFQDAGKPSGANVLFWFDLVEKKWNKMNQTGIDGSFWDHKAVIGFVPCHLMQRKNSESFPVSSRKRARFSI